METEFGTLVTRQDQILYALLTEQRKTNELLEKLIPQPEPEVVVEVEPEPEVVVEAPKKTRTRKQTEGEVV